MKTKELSKQAPNRQVMQYWLQQLQQKRWEFSNTRGSGQRDSWSSPTPYTGLVAKDTGVFVFEKPSHSDSMEKVRSDFAMETDTDGLVGVQSARGPHHHPNPLNFSSKLGHWSTELRNSMSGLRVGRGGGENRRSVFYTGTSCSAEEWEMLDAPSTKDINQDHKPPPTQPQPQPQTDTHRHSTGSPFSFDFGRSSSSWSRPKRTTLRDMMGSGRLGRSSESPSPSSHATSPVEWNGNRTNELQLRLQSQEQELTRLHEENNNLTEELASQKELVRLLQQTLRSTQREIRPAPPAPMEALLLERDGQVQALCGQMERLALEKESLQRELKGLKVKVDQRVFKDLLSEKLPRLHAHFDLYKVDSSLITFNWFLVLFVDSVNSDLLFKIWDAFLYEGPKIIFRFALALFKYKEEEFLKLQDSMAIFKYLRYFTRTILDWSLW
ncbi:hypothetical protein J4Q44_G00209180 [Coregonus suidteri]|uniref:Rab-GAP TBC domain-containing protein n=1 Tax=Coregonus suidteri TaxID=861788 RepID=A0AAN8QMV6_9TELE